MTIHKCHDCGAKEGQFHQPGCDMERCPFCGGQLLSCDCSYRELGLVDKTKLPAPFFSTAEENKEYWLAAGLPLEIYEGGLTPELSAKWDAILKAKGLVPYIQYPIVCAKCGKLWPDLYMVPNAEWEHYIQKDMRDKVICWECFDSIRKLIDANLQMKRFPHKTPAPTMRRLP
jgi:hypothetical protein